MTRVGLIGLGTISTALVELVRQDSASPVEVVGALVRNTSSNRGVDVPVFNRLDDLLACKPEVMAEAAGHEALKIHGLATLEASTPLIFLSVGALADQSAEHALRKVATRGRTWARAASGGVAGLDMIASAAQGGLESVIHRIISTAGGRFTMKGDNNLFNDAYQPSASDIIGARWMTIPASAPLSSTPSS